MNLSNPTIKTLQQCWKKNPKQPQTHTHTGGATENKGNTTSTPKAQQSLQKGQKDVKARGSESWL